MTDRSEQMEIAAVWRTYHRRVRRLIWRCFVSIVVVDLLLYGAVLLSSPHAAADPPWGADVLVFLIVLAIALRRRHSAKRQARQRVRSITVWYQRAREASSTLERILGANVGPGPAMGHRSLAHGAATPLPRASGSRP